jgi:hypothetical protein
VDGPKWFIHHFSSTAIPQWRRIALHALPKVVLNRAFD